MTHPIHRSSLCSPLIAALPLAAALALGCHAREPEPGAPSTQPLTAAAPGQELARKADAPPAVAAPTQPTTAMPADHCATHAASEAAGPISTDSIYNLHATLTDQQGAALGLDAFRGRPVLMAMFYASCTSICPMLIGHLQRVESLMPEALRANTRMLLVSLDPDRDTVEQLHALAARHGVDAERWHFVRTQSSSVQEIAAMLGVRYRSMPDGTISHSPVIVVLNGEGVIVRRVEAPLPDPQELVTALQASLPPPG